jgi:hypothetical protein
MARHLDALRAGRTWKGPHTISRAITRLDRTSCRRVARSSSGDRSLADRALREVMDVRVFDAPDPP